MFRRKNKDTHTEEEKTENKDNQTCSEVVDSTELEVCKKELNDVKDKLIRVTADLQNFKRRVDKEKIQWMTIAQFDLINDLLPIIDDFDRAMSEYEKKEVPEELKPFFDGFIMISKAFYKFLEKYNVSEIIEYKTFDPMLHEAIVQIESPNHKTNEIVEVVQKGFMFKDKVLRPAKVVVAK